MFQKILNYAALLILANYSFSASALDINYGNQTVWTVIFVGNVNMNGTTVTGSTSIVGALNATKSNLNSANIVGNASLEDSKINSVSNFVGNTTIKGTEILGEFNSAGAVSLTDDVFMNIAVLANPTITINNTSFLNESYFGISNLYLNNSNTKNVHISKSLTSDIQSIYLNNSTIVGDVHFDSGNGQIILQNNSSVSGVVYGGKIICN